MADPVASLHFDSFEPSATFAVTSTDFADGDTLAVAQASGMFGVPGGTDTSPQLSWSGAPEGTKSYAVTCFDPEAPTGSGFWHWTVFDIPADVTSLDTGVGTADGARLPSGAVQARTDANVPGFVGAGPPPGHGPHRYVFVVHALDVEHTGATADSMPAFVGFTMYGHTLARATITGLFER